MVVHNVYLTLLSAYMAYVLIMEVVLPAQLPWTNPTGE